MYSSPSPTLNLQQQTNNSPAGTIQVKFQFELLLSLEPIIFK